MNPLPFRFSLPFREQAGVISTEPVWIWMEDCYMYIHPTLWGLLCQVVTEWRHDRHIVG